MTKQQKTAVIIWLTVIGATLLFIWGHSLMPATDSQAESETIKWLLSLVLGEGALTAWILKHIRKIAHFAEFFLLGAEVCALRRVYPAPVMWLYGLGVAAVDEILQIFSPGRAPMVADVLLDYSGYLCGFGLLVALFWAVAKFRRSMQK